MSSARCPSCAAAVRPDDPWCTLCYADLRPAAVPEPELVSVPAELAPEPAYSPPAIDLADPLGLSDAAPAEGAAGPARWTCAVCHEQATYDHLSCPTCGRALLADETAQLPTLVKPGSSSSKAAVIFGGMTAFMLVILALLTVIGSVF